MNSNKNSPTGLTYPEDCKNSPLKELIKQMHIHFFNKDFKEIFHSLINEPTWVIIHSKKKMNSEQEIHHFLNNYKESIQAMHLNEIITHGKSAAAEGNFLLNGTLYHFCHLIKFNKAGKSGKIKEIRTFILPS